MKFSENQIKNFVSFLDYIVAEDDDTIIKHYSGRGMYGETCVGFVTNNPIRDITNLCLNVNEEAEHYFKAESDEFIDMVRKVLPSAKTDSMGLKTVVYFPNVSLPNDE